MNKDTEFKGLPCPNCGGYSSVIDTRAGALFTPCRRRRRECDDCKHKFSSYEIYADVAEELKTDQKLLMRLAERVRGGLNE